MSGSSGKFRFTTTEGLIETSRQWDLIAPIRQRQITEGDDLSLLHVLFPYILNNVSAIGPATVLDAGCGTGELSAGLAAFAEVVVGIDPSSVSIALAREHQRCDNLSFLNISIEEFDESARFDVITMNMVLMDAPRLDSLFSAVHLLLRPGGCLVATMTHPAFWPIYWGYASDPEFSYLQEIAVETEFRISLGSTGLKTTHFHRPLQAYLSALIDHGLEIIRFTELWPDDGVHVLYPQPWNFPRFIGFVARRA